MPETTLLMPDRVKELYSAAPSIFKELVSTLLAFYDRSDKGDDVIYTYKDLLAITTRVLTDYRQPWE